MAEIISLEILLKWRLVFSFLAILLNLWTGRWDWLVLVRLKKLRIFCSLWESLWTAVGGRPLSLLSNLPSVTFRTVGTRLPEYIFWYRNTVSPTDQREHLSQRPFCCFCLVLFSFFFLIFFFFIAIPFPFGRSLSSILFLSKWHRAVEQMMALWESGVVMRDVWCVYSTTESKNTEVLLCIANARVSREDTWWWCLVFTLGKLWVQEGPLQMCWNLENRNKVGWEWREEQVEKTRC